MKLTVDKIIGIEAKFHRVKPSDGTGVNVKEYIDQSTFLSELDPNGHRIYDKVYYPDVVKKARDLDENDNPVGVEYYKTVPVERVSLNIQEVIVNKHMTHLCGEEMQFKLDRKTRGIEKNEELFIDFKDSWKAKNMEVARYEFCQAVKQTGDAAFCAHMSNGKFSFRTLSFKKGDKMHPIYDETGKLKVFGRQFVMQDFLTGSEETFLELWNDTEYCVLRHLSGNNEAEEDLYRGRGTYAVNMDTYKFEHDYDEDNDWAVYKSAKSHAFTQIPIVYLHNPEGACWTSVQPLIDKMEMAISMLYENNKAYAFRIMFIKGGISVVGDVDGNARAILSDDPQSDAKFLEKADASTSFDLQLAQTWSFLKQGSFTVFPPDIKGADVTGVAIKIMYSPAIEQCIKDKSFFKMSMDSMIKLFQEGMALESNEFTKVMSLGIEGEMKIYIHQNDAENTNNLAIEKNAGIITGRSAREKSMYAAADEEERILDEEEHTLELEAKRERIAIIGSPAQSGASMPQPEGTDRDAVSNKSNTTKKLMRNNSKFNK